ncbi:hypothetical protein DL93DRAFT_2070593 [Clavulina sp. PMI_390]|nr:hypothetical protein DL93DRAFT_2070593 [Clavulina sp. PMI_390]
MSNVPSVRESDKSMPYFPLANLTQDGRSDGKEATATCFCGAVQLLFPIDGPGFLKSFVCHCTDCRKITASMFASNFSIADSYLTHVRGEDNLTQFGQSHTIGRQGNLMTNYFCKTCGSLMYRRGSGYAGMYICRLGTVDDFNLVEQSLRPTIEQFMKDRVEWLGAPFGEMKHSEGLFMPDDQ